jgi:hypothetical protein
MTRLEAALRRARGRVRRRYFSGIINSATASCSGNLREEAQPQAINREVAWFLAVGRTPVAITVERGEL